MKAKKVVQIINVSIDYLYSFYKMARLNKTTKIIAIHFISCKSVKYFIVIYEYKN